MSSANKTDTKDLDMISPIVVILIVLGLFILYLAIATTQEISEIHRAFARDLGFNLGAELIGALIIYVILRMAQKVFSSWGKVYLSPLPLSPVFLWIAYRAHIATGYPWPFVRDITINLGIDIFGAIIIFYVVERVSMQEQEINIRSKKPGERERN